MVGPLPAELQDLTLFSAAVFVGSKNIAGANSLIQMLKSPKSAPVLEATGMQLPSERRIAELLPRQARSGLTGAPRKGLRRLAKLLISSAELLRMLARFSCLCTSALFKMQSVGLDHV